MSISKTASRPLAGPGPASASRSDASPGTAAAGSAHTGSAHTGSAHTGSAHTVASPPPRPLAPLGGGVEHGRAVHFLWSEVPDATGYTLEVSPDRLFARDVLRLDAGPATEVALANVLDEAGEVHFWRVRARTRHGETRWSPYGRFVAATEAAAERHRADREHAETLARIEAERERQAEEEARERIPYVERDDTLPSDREIRMIGLGLLLPIVLIVVGVIAARLILL
ncbi:MAG: hypothetical protein ACK41D_10385 [Rubricoccaceae bacterium]